MDSPFRYATPDDAAALAELINFAGEGRPPYLWTNMAEPAERMGRRPEARDARSGAVSPTGTP